MNILSTLFRSRNEKAAAGGIKPAGVVKNEGGWYYEESQTFSSSQSTMRIDQIRPGDWEVFTGHCTVDGLDGPARREGVERFFRGGYRWLKLEGDLEPAYGDPSIKVNGTYLDTAGREHEVNLGNLSWDVTEEIKEMNLTNFWGRMKLIGFPIPGRDTKYMIRFDLMKRKGTQA